MSLDIWLTVGACQHCGRGDEQVMDKNITHNLHDMLDEAGCGAALYESAGHKAGEYVDVLDKAVAAMEADPERFREFDAPNGWGTYKHALPWLREVRDAFRRWPAATIGVSL